MRKLSVNAKALAVVAVLLAAQGLLVLAFVLPGHDPRPHDVPVGVVGPTRAARAVEARAPGALHVRAYPSQAAARAAIQDREVYAALVPGPRGQRPTLLVASAASPAVAQLLQASVGRDATARDLAPLDPDDPRGTTLNLLFLPLMVTCFAAVLLLGPLPRGRAALLGAHGLFAAAGGLLVIALVAGAIGALPGSYLALSGVVALIILAIALPTAGLVRLLGPAGVGVAAVLFLFIGNTGSGNATAPELLPGFWRAVGPLLPPGAGGSALRGAAYFDGAGLTTPLLVLGGWALLGALMILIPSRRRARPAETTAGAAVHRRVASASI
jgi:hypothetical protein